MRQQFIPNREQSDHDRYKYSADTLAEAFEVCTWAAEIVEVEGGFMAFESMSDYEIWLRQK